MAKSEKFLKNYLVDINNDIKFANLLKKIHNLTYFSINFTGMLKNKRQSDD